MCCSSYRRLINFSSHLDFFLYRYSFAWAFKRRKMRRNGEGRAQCVFGYRPIGRAGHGIEGCCLILPSAAHPIVPRYLSPKCLELDSPSAVRFWPQEHRLRTSLDSTNRLTQQLYLTDGTMYSKPVQSLCYLLDCCRRIQASCDDGP